MIKPKIKRSYEGLFATVKVKEIELKRV